MSPPPTRRTVLRSASAMLGVSLAGCLSSASSTEPTETPPPDRPDGFWRWVSIVDYDQPPEQYQVEIDMEVVQPWITAEKSARIAVSLTNRADTRRELGPAVAYHKLPADDHGGIVLDDTTRFPDADYSPSCIGTDGKDDEPAGYSGEGTPMYELDPGETVTRLITILDDPNVEGCLPPGVYPFEQPQAAGQPGDDSPAYIWTFSLGLQGNKSS